MKTHHSSLYQINTRIWLRRFDKNGQKARLKDVPKTYWKFLSGKGIDLIWFMGIWPSSEAGLSRNIFDIADLHRYQNILPDLKEEDMIGSPYAIEHYQLNPEISSEEDFAELKLFLNGLGIRIILDFVPNHFGAHSSLVQQQPELFLACPNEFQYQFPNMFYTHPDIKDRVFAHGKDPYFGPWRDTVQLNYCREASREFMIKQLEYIASICDGVRCDMTMIIMNRIFKDSWKQFLNRDEMESWKTEFWTEAIPYVKQKHPGFQLIAECYWNLEKEMLALGFDYSYDKEWTDHIHSGAIASILQKASFERDLMDRSVHFLENHDEERIAKSLTPYQSEAAAIILASMPGIRFYHQGQWEGRRIRIPVQLGREPEEQICNCLLSFQRETGTKTSRDLVKEGFIKPICNCNYMFYENLLELFSDPVFKRGQWNVINPVHSDNQEVSSSIFSILWSLDENHKLVLVNYSAQDLSISVSLKDHISLKKYKVLPQIVKACTLNLTEQLKLDLKAYSYALFDIKPAD